MLLDGVAYKLTMVDYLSFLFVTVKPEVKFLLLFLNDSNLPWACTGQTYIYIFLKKGVLSAWTIFFFCVRD